jgi:predicted Rossmann fold flavoprotein
VPAPAFDAVVIGAGAAGLFCASVAGQLGLRVLVVDHAAKVAEKIRISGGGRCNFTNQRVGPEHFLSDNPPFCRSALSRYSPQEFLTLVKRHDIAWHEKHKGQLFCDESSEQIIQMLLAECGAGGVQRWQPCALQSVRRLVTAGQTGQPMPRFELDTDRGTVRSRAVVVATGGLSIPKIGASDFGHRLAKQFGLTVTPLRPALVPLTFDAADWAPFASLSGLALPVQIAAEASGAAGPREARGKPIPGSVFDEDLLFTHRGLSGPAILQVSSFWQPGHRIALNLAPGTDLAAKLQAAKRQSRRQLDNELALHLPQRLADTWAERLAQPQHCGEHGLPKPIKPALPMPEQSDATLRAVGLSLQGWRLTPNGSEGYRKAEVTAGGVDTRALSQQTMEARSVPGLHFIGEVVDVTGWLGGYNFQWAWASGYACAHGLAAALSHR